MSKAGTPKSIKAVLLLVELDYRRIDGMVELMATIAGGIGERCPQIYLAG